MPAAADVCGTDSALFRLLCRAVFAPASDGATALKTLRLARFAVDQAPEGVRERLAAWPRRCGACGGDTDAA